MYISKFYKQVSLTLFALVVATQLMAQPGKNGPLTVTAAGTIVNAYDALAANAAAGATSITATTIANLNTPTALAQGDLVMIIQMQGATMDVTNTAAYGTVTALNNAGRYEYAYVCSVAGNVINLTSALTNSYTATGRAQIVRVPQYTTLTVNAGASITAPAWNGTTGGVVAIHANGVVTVNGTIQANAMGFRGGRIENNTSAAGAAVIATYFANDGGATGAEKGESIVGYGAEYDALGGRYNRGAPANGGGGGNGHNAGGGGGANGNNGVAYTGTGNPDVSGGAGWVSAWNLEAANFATSVSSGGGRGGYTYGASDQNAATLAPGAAAWGGDQRDNVGGFGGHPLTANAENRIFLGGGGGAGDGNNNANADGGDGGGIVYIIAPSIAGTGTITSNGQTAPNTIAGNNDAPGGGGAGGTIIIKSTVANTITVNANGGNGGNQLTIGAESEGPGGGGGGGFVAVAAGTPTITVAAGANGTTASTAVTEFIPNGATRGATGLSTTVTTTFVTSVPPTVVASSNTPVCVGSTLNLTSTITNGRAPFTYSWTGPVAFTSTAANPTRASMTAAMAGAYNVTITDAGGCTASATTTVVVNALPVVSITGANPICVGATTTLSPTTGGTWASSNAAVATVTNAGVVTGVSGGTATFTFTQTSTGCTSLATPAVTVNALPVVSITGANPICVGATTTLSPTTGGTWASSNAAVATVTNAGVVTGVSGGTATFTFTNTATGCTSAATPAVTVNALPVVSITGANPICVGSTTTLSPTTGGTWASSNAAVATVTNAGVVTGVSGGTATFTFTQTSTGCTSAATPAVTVNARPVVSITGANPICVGSTTTLSPTTGGTWASSNAAVATVTNAGVVTGVAGGTATFTFTQTSTGCTSLATPAVTVNARPVVSITGANPICVGATTTLSPTTGGTWASSNAAVATVTNAGVVTGVSGGTATFTFTNTATGCTSLATPAVTVNPLPVVSITGGNPICPGLTTTLSPNVGGTWTSSNTAVATVTNAGVVTGVAGGTATFTFTNTATGCVSAPTPALTVTPRPVVSITGANPICVGSTTTLSPTTGGTWASSNAAVATVTNAGVVTGVAGGTATFSFILTSTGCTSLPTPAVTVNARPTVSVTGPTTICAGQTTTLSPTTGGTWTSANTAVATVTNAGVVTGVASGVTTFTFTETATGCTSLPTSSVTVVGLPVATIIGSNPICEGSTTTLSPISGGTWTSSNTAVATVTNAGVVTGVSGGSATFTFTQTSTGCTSLPSAPVTVIARPVVSITGANPICAGTTTTLSPTTGGTWTSSNTAVATVTNAGVVTGVSGGTATFTFTETASGCSSLATPAVTVTARPVVSITGANPICVGSTTTLSPTTGGTWASSNAAVATVTNAGVVTGVASGVASFTFTETSTGCASLPTPNITVNSRPGASISGVNPICVGSTTTLSPAAGGTWASSNAAVATVTNAGIVTGVSGGTATFTFTQTSTGCSSLPTATLTVNARPVVSITGANPICVGSTTTLSPTTGGTWVSSNAPVATVTNAGIVTGVSSGSATFTFTQTSTGCVSLATPAVTVNPLPATTITATPNPVCQNATLNLSAPAGATTYVWGGSGVVAANAATTTAAPALTGTQAYTVTITGANGCTASGTTNVTVNTLPSTTITATPNPVCQNATLNLSVPAGATTYVWGGNGVVAANAATTTAVPTLTGTQAYTVTVTGTNGCTASGTTNVTVSTLPNTTITATPSPVCQNSTLNLSVPTGETTYVWSGNGIVAANAATTTAVPTASGTQTYTVTITGASGCTASGTTNVTVNVQPVIAGSSFTNPTSCGGTQGTISLTGLAASTTYTVNYDRNGSAATPASLTTNASGQLTITGLNAGAYTNFTVTTAAGCTSTPLAGPITLVDPSAPVAVITPNNAGQVCNTPTGVTLVASGGTSYAWSNSVNAATNPLAATTADISYTVTVTDASGCTDTETVLVLGYTNAICNQPPVANDDTAAAVDEDGANATVSVLTNDTDPQGNGTIVTSSVDLDPATPGQQTLVITAAGVFSVNAAGVLTFDPANNYNGTATITYTIEDNAGAVSNIATVTFVVNPVNDAPIAVDDTNSTTEETPVSGNVGLVGGSATNDDDVDIATNGQTLSYTQVGTIPAAQGTLVINADGTYTFTPATDFNGTVVANYTVCDNGAPQLCDNGTLTITVSPVNDAPVAIDDTNATNEDTPVSGNVGLVGGSATNDNDVDIPASGQTLSYTQVGTIPAAQGTLVINADGTYTYTPAADFNGTVVANYTVCDNGAPQLCDNGVLTITVNPVNDAPIAVDDVNSTNEETPVSGNVGLVGGSATNDNDVDIATNGQTLSYTQVGTIPAAQGTLVINADGTYTFTPATDFNGTVVANYTVCDNGAPQLCDNGTLTITVNPVNDAPIAIDDTNTTNEDTPVSGNVGLVGGSATNDNDVDIPASGQTLSYTQVGTIPAAQGTLVINADGTYTYTPAADFNGTVVANYTVCDNGAPQLCDNGILTITVNPVNDAPIAVDDVNSTAENTPVSGNVGLVGGSATNDNDVDIATNGQTLSYTQVGTIPAAQGTLVINADGTYTFTPTTGFNGTVVANYTVCDNGAPQLCDNATLTITVIGVNDAPIAVDDTNSTNEDTPVSGNVGLVGGSATNDNDVDIATNGQTLSYTQTGSIPASQGTLVINADGTYTFTPATDFNGTVVANYTVCDNGAPQLCDNGTLTITVNPVNDAPIAIDDTNTTNEDTPVSGNVGLVGGSATNDNDVDIPASGQTLSYTQTGSIPASQGTLVINADGTYTFTPATDFNGTVVATYQVCDNGAPQLCDNGVLTITVNPVNDAPIAIDDTNATNEDTPVSGNVGLVGGSATNDDDVDIATNGQTLSYTQTGSIPASQGTLVINADGTYTFTPATDFNGTVVATYQVCDNGAPQLCDNGVLTITVNPVNDAPIAIDDTNTTNEDTPVSGNVGLVGGSATNDDDVDIATNGQTLSYTQTGSIPASQGTLVINADGTYTFTPAADFNGTVVATYQVCDNGAPQLCDNGVLTITVNPVNDAPVANDDVASTNEDTPVTITNIFVNDNDNTDSGSINPLSTTIVTPPTNGTVVIDPLTGVPTYTPNADFNGTDQFTYQVCDNGTPLPALCDQAIVTITVNAVNDAPVAIDDTNATNEDTPVSGNVGLVGGSATNDDDVDIATSGQTLSYTQIGSVSAAQGTLVINADGTYTFTPATNFNGTVVTTYQVCDNGTPSLCDTATLTITVNAVNDAPVAVADINNTLINTPVSGQVLTNDSDVDGDPLTTTVTTTPTNGAVVLNSNGTYTYTPNTGFIGTDVFTYTVCDNGTPQLCDVTTVTIIVDIQTHFNDITVANDDNAQTFVNVPVSGQVLTNDFDPENDPLTVTSNTNPTNGTVVVNANGTFTYTPNAGYVGTDAFTYVACDPFGHCATATVNIDVIEDPNGPAVNDAPFAQDDAVATVLNTPVNGNVLPNDSDPNGDALTVTSNTNPANGTVTVNANGTFTYTPNASYVGPDQFTYTVCDNGTPSACDVATVYITVYPTAPDAVDDINTGVIGTVVVGQVLTNDNGGGLPINLNTTPVLAPVNGTVVFDPSGNGNYTYTPNSLTFVGEDSFQYAICNSYNVCDTAWVVIQVTSPANNNPPVANDDQANTYSGVAVSGTLANNDFDPENGALTYNATPVSGPANGTIVINANGTFTYTPNAAFVGQDLIEYQVCDPDGNCATAFLTVDVVVDPNGPANDPPFAQDDAFHTVTSTPVSGDLSPNDSEPNNDPLTYSTTPVSGPANGTVTINANGTFTYTPNEGFFGNDQFVYTVCDNGTPALCDVATAYIVVLPLAPNAELDINNTLANVPVTGNVLTNDSDPQNLTLTVTGNTTPNHGTVVVGSNGDYTYTPNAGFVGSDTFSYVVCNTVGLCTTETVIINVLPNNQTGNDAPDAHNDAAQTLMDTPVNGNVSSNDIDPDADPLTVTTNTNPTNGTVVVNADGTFTYTPNAGFTGLDTFSYTICDPFGLCDGAIVVIDVTIDPNGTANNPPFAQDDADAGNTNEPITGDLSSNDSDPNGDPLAYFPTPISGPNNGTVVINGNGTYTYTPNQGYHGPDQFVYVVCDGGTPSLCDTATVYLIVYPAAPQGENDLVTTLVDVPVGGNVLDNDEDPNNDPLTTTVTPLTPPVNGVLTTLNNDGTFLYTPNSGFVGLDSFQVIICNPVTLCDTTWVFINVRTIIAGNNPPLANNDAAQTLVDVPVSGQVLNNDTDPDQDVLTTTVVTNPVNGTLILNPDGTFTYTPNAGFNGTDVFTYSACDGNGACDTAVVTVTVSFDPNGPANNPPYAQSDANVTNVNTPVNGTVAANDSDPNNDPLTFSTVSNPTNGTLVLNPDGTYTYTPNVGYNGPDVFTYQVCDGGTPSLCDTATVSLVVFPGAPDGQNDINNTTPNTPVTGTVATNDEDPNGLPLTFTVTTPPTNGTLVFNPNGTYTYTPNAGFGGPDTIIYVVCNNFLCDTAVLIINVHGDTYQQNDPPVAGDDNVQTHSGTPVNGDVANNDVDPDGDPLSVNTTPVTPPTNGTLVINTNGTFTYTPNSGFNGTDTFTYVICDGGSPAACDTATVIITVTPDPNGSANDAPFAQDDANSTTQNVPVNGLVYPNDSDPNGDTLSFGSASTPAHGTVVLNADGTYTYTPNAGYAGPDQFTYVACDGATPNLCDTATVYLIVYPFETTTQIITDTISFGPPSTTICLPYDGELPGSIVSITDACSTSNNATFTVNSLNPPCITFTASAVGVDTFCLVLTDTFGLTDTITYTLTVVPNTDTLRVTIPAGTDSIYCIDAYTGIIQPGYDNPTVTGTLDINGINEGIITANNGVYCFTYSADNGPGNDTLVIINFNGTYYDTTYVIITHTLTAPVAVDDNGAGSQGNPITIYSLGNDTLNGNILGEPGIVTAAQNGTVIWNATENGFIYTPNDNFCGADSFTYVITNESLLSDTATVYITVACTDTLIVYNGISPNGDGRNDFLVIENIENVPNNTIYIYNRWGNLIYQTNGYSNTDPAHRFSGQWDGKDLPDGTYFYILNYVNRRGSDERINGYIIINR